MKVLITGANGFVGKKLVTRLKSEGHEVIAIVRPKSSFLFDKEISFIEMDLTRLDVNKLPQVDAIYTLAQSSNFRNFPDKAQDVFDVNINANQYLWDWALKTKVKKIIHASSGGIYGQKSGVFFQEDVVSINSPLGYYLSTKLCSELLLQSYAPYFETCVNLRPFFIYGQGQRADMLIPRLIDNIREGRAVDLQGQDGIRMNPLYIEDAVDAFSKAIHLKGNHTLNIAGPDILTLREIAEKIGNFLNKKPQFIIKNEPPKDYIANLTKAKEKLNYTMTSFEKGLRLTIV